MAFDYSRASDLELWQQCQANDMRAYNELFDRYAAKLYKQTIRFIKETATAEELVMDMLFNLWQKRHQTNIEGDVSAYLHRCMRNLVLNHLRRKITITTSIDLLKENDLVDNRQADHQLLTADTEKVYLARLEELSPQRRRVFLLSREENLSYSEIAREMNLSVNTVENYMVAALSALRKGTKECTVTFLVISLTLLEFINR